MIEEETIWITLRDGCRLAARLWLPTPAAEPVPAILEYLPYRRRDRHRADDAILHPAFAAAGYAALRVDMRGSGDSDGIMADEYTPQEWEDAVAVIEWIARQDWCNGSVGMIGLSWSGFNSLQVAALAPPALKAIVTTCASDDRYADDMHYMGGCLLTDNLQYGATLFTWLATPPDPRIVGDRWREMWLDRLAAIDEPPAARWMRHPARDEYWKSGSVCEDYSRIKAAVLAVGGWADGYTNAVMRLLNGLPGPRKGLIGPWGHAFPHVAAPGPRIDFLAYVIRWWDHWLRRHDTGIMAEPMLCAWMQAAEPPRPRYADRQGRWITEPTWPSPEITPVVYHLIQGGLALQPQGAFVVSVCSPATTGIASGEWCPYGLGADMPIDQREDDAGSACFDSEPLQEAIEILGRPEIVLNLSSDREQGFIAVRLSAVAPAGISARLTYGLQNLVFRRADAQFVSLRPGEKTSVRLKLKSLGYTIPAGYRLRVSISTAYWPLIFPGLTAATITLHGGSIALPLRKKELSGSLPQFGAAWSPPPLAAEILQPPERGRTEVARDMATGLTQMTVVRNLGGLRIAETDLELRALGTDIHRILPDDPATARSEVTRLAEFRRDDWHARVETRSILTVTNQGWRLRAHLQADENDDVVFAREWDLVLPFGSEEPTGPIFSTQA